VSAGASMLNVKVTAETLAGLDEEAGKQGMTRSDLVRIRIGLQPEQPVVGLPKPLVELIKVAVEVDGSESMSQWVADTLEGAAHKVLAIARQRAEEAQLLGRRYAQAASGGRVVLLGIDDNTNRLEVEVQQCPHPPTDRQRRGRMPYCTRCQHPVRSAP
jgi:hypothetical protein